MEHASISDVERFERVPGLDEGQDPDRQPRAQQFNLDKYP